MIRLAKIALGRTKITGLPFVAACVVRLLLRTAD
jgi:hypothetical protein